MEAGIVLFIRGENLEDVLVTGSGLSSILIIQKAKNILSIISFWKNLLKVLVLNNIMWIFNRHIFSNYTSASCSLLNEHRLIWISISPIRRPRRRRISLPVLPRHPWIYRP